MGERESEDQTLSGQHGSMSQDRAAPLRTLLLGQLHTDADQDLQRAALLRTLLLGQLHTNADDDNGGDDRQRCQTRIPGLALSCYSWIE